MRNVNPRPIAVVGIGNILMHDEGIGVRVIEHLAQMKLPDGVELVDGGTAGADLIDVFSDRKLLIIVDAISGEYAPGTVLRMSPEDTVKADVTALSLHEVGIVETLEMTKHLNCAPQKVVVFGVKPGELSCGIGLSPEMEGLVEILSRLVLTEIHRVKA